MSTVPMRVLALSALLVSTSVFAAKSKPQPLPIVDTILAPRDVAFPGTIHLDVNATDVDRGIIEVRETVPAIPGPLVLLAPKWLPGNHNASGQIDKLAGFTFTANGQPLRWVRDKVDVYAFHLDVPAGATSVEAHFQFLSPTDEAQGRVVVTREMLNIQWDAVSLYPAGTFVRNIPIVASLTLPAEWKAATALRPSSMSPGNRISYGEVASDT
jgi:predicted metalloprotease with PDZ domain